VHEIVLRIQNRDGQPMVDAAFLTSLMQGMQKRDESGMTWSITVDEAPYAGSMRLVGLDELAASVHEARIFKVPGWLRRWHRSEQEH
jgi:hypothetical protein